MKIIKIDVEWFPKIKQTVLFYVHTPFCEQLCNFCLCSEITRDYERVKNLQVFIKRNMFESLN